MFTDEFKPTHTITQEALDWLSQFHVNSLDYYEPGASQPVIGDQVKAGDPVQVRYTHYKYTRIRFENLPDQYIVKHQMAETFPALIALPDAAFVLLSKGAKATLLQIREYFLSTDSRFDRTEMPLELLSQRVENSFVRLGLIAETSKDGGYFRPTSLGQELITLAWNEALRQKQAENKKVESL